MSKHFETTYKIQTQRQQSTDFYVALKQNSLQPLDPNAYTILILARVNIPSSSKVRLVFGIGFGLQIIGVMPLTIANQYVMLIGKGGPDIGFPNVLTFPESIHKPASIATITVEQFSTKLIYNVRA